MLGLPFYCYLYITFPHHLTFTAYFLRLLGNNHFSGEIPDSFEELTSLAHLYQPFLVLLFYSFLFLLMLHSDLTLSCRDLSSNNLTGHLPPSFGNLSAVSTMWVHIIAQKDNFYPIFNISNGSYDLLLTGTCRIINSLGL